MDTSALATTLLRAAIIVYALIFAFYFLRDCLRHKEDFRGRKTVTLLLIGFVTNFFDTLGIGNFATIQAAFKLTKSSPDETMPGTLNVGCALCVIFEFILFLGLIEIAPLTLVTMIAGAILGSLIGARIVSKWSVRIVRLALGCALVFLAFMMTCRLLGVGVFGVVGTATALTGWKLIVSVIINFFLGALMTIGVGLYTPCIALCSAMGLNVKAAFPMMFGSCAFLMPSCGFEFIRNGRYDRAAALLMTVSGFFGILLAFFVVKSLPLTVLTWIIIAVMLYTSFMFFRDALKKEKAPQTAEEAAMEEKVHEKHASSKTAGR